MLKKLIRKVFKKLSCKKEWVIVSVVSFVVFITVVYCSYNVGRVVRHLQAMEEQNCIATKITFWEIAWECPNGTTWIVK